MRRELKLAPELRELLLDEQFSEFSMLELRDEFELRFGLDACASRSELRKILYRRILPLVKKGYLDKQDQGAESPCRYRVNEQFKADYVERAGQAKGQNVAAVIDKEAPQINSLRAKLNQYQVDMLACAGECKEYQHLAEEFPHLRDQIEPMYRSARERSSELMGQLRAINNLLQRPGISQ